MHLIHLPRVKEHFMEKIKQCYSYVRFSSKQQISGDSLRRQTAKAEEYAQKHELVLDTTLNMHDLGLSGYSGEHKTKGALGNFLKLVKNGRIEKGSLLIVESLDRLSREKISIALNSFTSLLDSGISIMTLMDQRLYTPDYDLNELISSITIMSSAHYESKQKQERLLETWKEKRANADKLKLTSLCPKWMVLNEERTDFDLIPERVEIIEHIIRLYLSGMGIATIARELNKDNIATWGRSKLWSKSYIWKIMRARTLIGEYQPKKYKSKEGGKGRKTIFAGDPIKDYYPRAISDKLFYKIQDRLTERKGKFGKIGNCSNLFTHIAKCGYCGASMHYVNNGKACKYLTCGSARRGGDCKHISIKYEEFEDSFLSVCRGLNVKDIIEDTENETVLKIVGLKDEINVISHKIEESNGKINDWLDLYSSFDRNMKETVKQKMSDEQELNEKREISLLEKDKELHKLQQRKETSEYRLKTAQENIEILRQAKGNELVSIRMKVQTHIQSLVDTISVYSTGLDNKPEESFSGSVELKEGCRDDKCYNIYFKDGGVIFMEYHIEIEKYQNVGEFTQVIDHEKMQIEVYKGLPEENSQ